MPKLTALLIIALFVSSTLFAQTNSVSGTVADTAEKKQVQNAVVILLYLKDSIFYKFTRTDAKGNYTFKNLTAGKYIMMTTHPYFGDVVLNIDIKDGENRGPAISLTSKSKLLAEVIVKSGTPIKIKGDTTVYTADSFKIRAGANVEELLKKLPGIQVDKDGKITAMGEQVKKVLVDGEEFFGDDPGIATKNLRADIVKEVEVFDKKSDQATFTGIDDGVKDKTINLKLKDNAKKGYFGKAEAGTDFSNYYNNSIMANSFKGKRKLAAYGIMSNTGQTNLDWKDNQNYGSDDISLAGTNGSGYNSDFDGGDDSYFNGRGGIPTNWNGGFHYSNKFDNNKQSFNGGYKVTKVNSPTGQRNYTTNFTGDSSYNSNSISEGFSTKLKQSLNIAYEANIDSANSLKLTARGNLNNTKSNSTYNQESVSDKSLLINNISRRSTSDVDNYSLSSNLLWKHKFKKTARTLTANLSYSISDSKDESFLYSKNDYYKNGIPNNNDTTDQKNLKDNRTNTFSGTITYTEPLAKDLFLSFTYAYSSSVNENLRASYSKDISAKYTTRIDSLSNSYKFNQINNKPGVSFRLAKKKYNFSIGTAVSISHFEQDDRTQNLTRKYNFTNFFPTASFYVKLKGYAGFRINYNGFSKAPTLSQLQPVIDNTDQINQYIGNPHLNQSFTHSMYLSYNFYNVLQEKGMWLGIDGNVTQNAFVNERTLDGFAKSISRTVNANGNYNFNLYLNYNFKWKKPGILISFFPTANISRNISYIKNAPLYILQKSANTNSSYGFKLQLRKEKKDKYEVSINPNITRVMSKNSISSNATANYWQGGVDADVEVTLPLKFRINTEVNFAAKGVDPRFPAKNKFTIWNAALKRNIFKDALEVSLSVKDILNERRGYERSFNEYRYSETFYTTLKRYWMLTLTWNFSKNGKPTSGY